MEEKKQELIGSGEIEKKLPADQDKYEKISEQTQKGARKEEIKIEPLSVKKIKAKVARNLAYIFVAALTLVIMWYCIMASVILFEIPENQQQAYSIIDETA